MARSHEDSSNPSPDGEPEVTQVAEPKKRKPIETRSIVWEHFQKIYDSNGIIMQLLSKKYKANPKKHGTTSMKNHIHVCRQNPNRLTRQSKLAFTSGSDNESVLTNWVFNQDRVRKATAKMIVINELPLRFVEGRGFRQFVQEACPMFKIPSRWTVNRDIFAMHVEERKNLKKYFKEHSQRVSLTTDTWTSIQRINYMCVTAHYIDAEWKLNKKIISFVPIQSHKGDAIAKALELCLVEWGIQSISTITVDNASSNDVAIGFLKTKLVSWGCSPIRARYLHVRCIAHILNLVVQDGLKMANSAVKKLRDNVRWVRGSPARLLKFRDLASTFNVSDTCSLSLDVPTRWNSTYMMIKNALPYRVVFEHFDDHDASFQIDLSDSILMDFDWVYLESFLPLLKSFYEMTLKISGSLYVTANSYLPEICDLAYSLSLMIQSPNVVEQDMGVKMKEKFSKYWGNPEKMNSLIFFANILDPRDKYEFMEDQFIQLFGKDKSEACLTKVKSDLVLLFEDYVRHYSGQSQSQSQSQPQPQPQPQSQSQSQGLPPKPRYRDLLKKQKLESGALEGRKSELDAYLGEDIVDDMGNDFDLLLWWKVNSARFPVLSKLARDVLAVPISTVASESTFSTSGRVLDNFRSSLTPKIVEALICTQDWLRGPTQPVSVEENLEDLEKFEKEMENLRLGSGSGSVHGEDTPNTPLAPLDDLNFDDFDFDATS
ncbi:hypothetical protein OSB04_004089 [Centaurea solstitialis]|uniref:Transposase n=1 Tax=Centaurea solstitialis TaxID=347529 RepID=A0AA38TW55_9ASTR|nr:hypothetical protein OSB04_004089 [Centaurea solstitialis]